MAQSNATPRFELFWSALDGKKYSFYAVDADKEKVYEMENLSNGKPTFCCANDNCGFIFHPFLDNQNKSKLYEELDEVEDDEGFMYCCAQKPPIHVKGCKIRNFDENFKVIKMNAITSGDDCWGKQLGQGNEDKSYESEDKSDESESNESDDGTLSFLCCF